MFRLKNIIQLMLLLSTLIPSISCSKSHADLSPGKDLPQSKTLQFNIRPAADLDEETAKDISVRLKLSVLSLNLSTKTTIKLWDTLITHQNLYQLTRTEQPVTKLIEGNAQQLQNLILNYTVIYNNRGNIITKTRNCQDQMVYL